MTEAAGVSLSVDCLGGSGFDGDITFAAGPHTDRGIALVDIMNTDQAFARSPLKRRSFNAWPHAPCSGKDAVVPECNGELEPEELLSALDSTREEDFEDPYCQYGDLDSDVDITMASVEGDEDPQYLAEYVENIFRNRGCDQEACRQPEPNYMQVQPELDASVRASTVDWFVEVQMKYHLKKETLFLAVSILDRFLATKRVRLRDLRLVACTALFIAGKFEELSPPDVRDFVFLMKQAPHRPSTEGQPCAKEAILGMEVRMLTALEFCLCRPTAAHFLQKYLRANRCSEAHQHLLQYLLELALLDFGMTRFSPAIQTVAASLISNRLLKLTPAWPAALARRSKSTEVLVGICVRDMLTLLQATERSPLQEVRKKFLRPEYSKVAAMCMDKF
mmetsp:Transcript_97931/g.178967  ORF Transcript_97931/g.178967 Transcript_97931/m.178967 type:complete len:391 (+) Transcript_97931:87-1259(+)